jgi:hypothetical protein
VNCPFNYILIYRDGLNPRRLLLMYSNTCSVLLFSVMSTFYDQAGRPIGTFGGGGGGGCGGGGGGGGFCGRGCQGMYL